MKKMKKMCVALVVSSLLFAGCGYKPSGITITQAQNTVVKEIDSSWSLSSKESDDGYTFTGGGELNTGATYTIKGEADKDQNITKISMSSDTIYTEFFNTASIEDMVNCLNNFWTETPLKLNGCGFVMYSAYLIDLVSEESSNGSNGDDDLRAVLALRGTSKTIDGWKMSVTSSGETATITAEYVGK